MGSNIELGATITLRIETLIGMAPHLGRIYNFRGRNPPLLEQRQPSFQPGFTAKIAAPIQAGRLTWIKLETSDR